MVSLHKWWEQVAPLDCWSTSATVTAYGAGDPDAGFFFPANCEWCHLVFTNNATLQEGDQWAYNPKFGLRTLSELITVYHSTVPSQHTLVLSRIPDRLG